jgi:hypothetical protein
VGGCIAAWGSIIVSGPKSFIGGRVYASRSASSVAVANFYCGMSCLLARNFVSFLL